MRSTVRGRASSEFLPARKVVANGLTTIDRTVVFVARERSIGAQGVSGEREPDMLHSGKCAAIAVIAVIASSTHAGVIGFREGFVNDAAGWRSATGVADLDWSAASGSMDASFVTSTFNLLGAVAGDDHQAVFAAHTMYNSSNGAFAGRWIDEGVTAVSFRFRHNLSEAIRVTARFAPFSDAPGCIVATSSLIEANAWTTITFDLRRESEDIISFEGARYAACLSSVEGMQVGFMVSSTLAGQDFNGSFSMTDFTIVPTPAAGSLLLGFGAAAGRRRR